MSNGPQFNDRQKLILDDLNELYANRFESPVVPTATEGDDRPPLSSYSPTIQNIFGGEGFKKVYSETEEEAMRKMLVDNDIDADSFFKNDPEATPVDVMRATNYQNFATREERYNKEGTFSSEEAKIQGLEDLNKKYNSMFEGNMVYPKLGARVADLVPSFVMDDDVRRADFEQAIRNEYGLKFDLDSSEMIGDVYIEGSVLNEPRKLRYRISDAGAGLTSNALDVMSGIAGLARGIDSYFGVDVLKTEAEINEDYQQRKESGEAQTKNEAGDSFLSSFNLDDGLFWDAVYSTDARNDWYESHTYANTVDFQQLSDGADADLSKLWRATTDQFVQSAPLIADIIAGNAIAKGALKRATKAVSRKAAGKYATRAGGRYASQSTGRFMSKEAVMKINEKAAKINRIINGTGGFFAADALISAGIHADNVGQEWYDNLTPQQRFAYLASESSAETLSAIVLEGVVIKGFGRAKKALGQGGFRGQKKFIKELGKAVSESVLVGASAEAAAEAGTAAWQYWNEIQAKKATDPNAVGWEQEVFEDRVFDGFKAGVSLGAVGGLFGGLTGGAASAYVSTRHPLSVEANKEIKKAAQEMVNATNSEARKAAAERFEKIVQKHSGAKTSLTRAYYRLSQQNPEAFTKITELQREINLTVRRFKKSEDPEQQEAQKRELERLIQEKQQVENDIAKESGAETFDDMISEEVEKLGTEREEKLASFKERKRNSPEAEADRLAEIAELQELEEQRTSLEAAQDVNSSEQNADDDAQDREGETQEDSDAINESLEDDSLEGDGDNQFSNTIEEGTASAAVVSKYRDIVGTVNNLMKAFKKFGIKVVMHKTSDSYRKATGGDSRGVFRDNDARTIHFNLEKMSQPTKPEEEDIFGEYNTPIHEFLHLALVTADLATLKKFEVELMALARQVGMGKQAKEIFEAVERTYKEKYKGKGSSRKMLEEQVVTTIERLLAILPESRKEGFLKATIRKFLKVFGIDGLLGKEPTASEFEAFLNGFKESVQSGVEFQREAVSKEARGLNADSNQDSLSEDLGMNRGGFKSTAYPDLIRKKVRYSKTLFNKIGGTFQVDEEVFVNDYWHFRNWWVRETGNGKRADMLSGFNYDGENGQRKKVNAPKPKIDKNTGKPVDMAPRVKTSSEMKIAANQRSLSRGDRARDRDKVVDSLVLRMKEIVGVSTPSNREAKSEFFIDEAGIDTQAKSELPVVFSDTIFVDGLKNFEFDSEYDAAVRSTMDDFAFLVPKNQAGEFAYSIRNNGDGTVTIEAHSSVKPKVDLDSTQEGTSLDGSVDLSSDDLVGKNPEPLFSVLQRVIGRPLEKLKLSDYNGTKLVLVFYDPTTGDRSGVGADFEKGLLFSQYDEKSAYETVQSIENASIKDLEERLKKASTFGKSSVEYQKAIEVIEEVDEDGNVFYRGKILLATGFMRSSSAYGNTDAINEIIGLYKNYYESLSEKIGKEAAEKILVDSFREFVAKLDESQKNFFFDIAKESGLMSDSKNFNLVRVSQNNPRSLPVPVTSEGVFKLLESTRDSKSAAFRRRSELFKLLLTNTKRGLSNLLASRNSDVDAPRGENLFSLMEEKGIMPEQSAAQALSQTVPYYKIFNYKLKRQKDTRGREIFTLENVEVIQQETKETELGLSFGFGIKPTESSDLMGEFASEERLEFADLLSDYIVLGGEARRKVTKETGEKTIKGVSKAIDLEIEKAEKAINQWDATENTPEAQKIINEVKELNALILNKEPSPDLKKQLEKKIKRLTNPKSKTEAVRKAAERVSLSEKLSEAKKKKTSFQQSVKGEQNSATVGSVAIDTDNSTRDGEAHSVDLVPDPSTNLPFEPNNLSSFEAFVARVDQLFANKYANVMRLQKVIEKAKGKVVDLSKDFINAEALLYGKTANDLDKLDGKVKDISLEMKDKGLNSEDVSEYLIARHAKERNAVISERTEGKDEAGSGMTNERADEIMNSLSPEKKAALESVAAKVDAITADTRKTMVDFGLEEKSTIEAFEAMFQNYVPLGGLALDEQNADTSLYPTGGAGMSVYGDTTKRARGRKSEAQNVLAQAIAQNAAVHAKARKNEALSSLYNLVKDNPNPKVWRLAKEVPFDAQSAVGVRVNGEQQFIVFANPDMAKSLKNMGVEKLDLFSKAMRRFSGFLRRSFTTANPEFIISNFARDIQSALFNAMAEADIPGGQIPGRHIAAKVMTRVKQTLPALLKNAVGKDLSPEMAAYFEEFKEDGGQTGWGFVKDVGTIAAEIESEVNEKSKAKKAAEWMAKNSIDVIENINDAFENSVRLAAYIEARKAGVSREKAAELSKNITVNFNRSGELGPMANAWYMFFNASVQGTVRLARSLGTLKDIRKPNGELESWHKRLNGAQKMAFGLSLTTGMLTMINMAMSEDDEDGVSFYEKIPDYEKERNLIIMYDGKNYLKIPLPYGFNVFANIGSSMAEAANGQREPLDAGMFLLNSAFSSFSPISFGQSKDAAKYLAKGAAPTILKPFVDIAVNETYFGSSVYREQFPVGAPKPQAEMSYRSPEGIKSFFKWINEATGGSEQVPGAVDFNPDKFWYAFEYYIGGAGQFVTRSLGTGKDLFETIKEGKKVPMKANDFPFIRKLYGEASKYYDSDKYTENANLVSQLYKERKEAEDKNDKRYKGVMKLESARKLTEKKIKRLRKLRKEARDIENYVERQNRIYELYEKERSLLMQFNKQYEQIRGEN